MRDTKALRAARESETDPYKRRFTYPKWTATITVCQEHRLFSRLPEFAGWTREQHAQTAENNLIIAKAEDGQYGELVSYGLRLFGEGDGRLISGCYRSHWPELFKNTLRTLAHSSGEHYSRSLAHWYAARKTRATWLRLKENTKA